jgi:fructan beta-fructosidase
MKTIELKIFSLVFLILFIISCKSDNKQLQYREQHRPQFHFSPPAKWMNDPNGMVFYDGSYHLFYQYYPDSTVWGPMHWGHAVSKDLVHWKNLPVAIYPDSLGYIFSGSAVIDWKNTSGLQKGENPPIVAIFTHHSEQRIKSGRNDFQNQSIAYSNDKGNSFVKYQHNPVISNQGDKDFRDPKVIWNEDLQKWVMVLAVGQKVKFYSSSNLLKWEYLSEFGSGDGAHGGVWECPDLFPLKAGNLEKWILLVSINPGAPNNGSGTQYFIGDFDGKKFINDNAPETRLWLDYGPDNYAGVTWSDIPADDGRRIFIGWMSNWIYANIVPTVKWRSAMTIPRTLELRNSKNGLRLFSIPVEELKKLRKNEQQVNVNIDTIKMISGLNEVIINTNLAESTAEEFGFVFSNSLNEKLIVCYNVRSSQFYIDRTNSGKTDFSQFFPVKHFAPRIAVDSILKMHLYIDYSSLELFADDGIISMTETFFPNKNFDRVSFFRKNGKIKDQKYTIFELNPIW